MTWCHEGGIGAFSRIALSLPLREDYAYVHLCDYKSA